MNDELYELVVDKLTASSLDAGVIELVDAACRGKQALEACLAGAQVGSRGGGAEKGKGAKPVGAYLKSLSVTGFRGIAGTVKLEVKSGPGLTLVIGRNGSGKSSLAEGFETLLTGENRRWSQKKSGRQEWEQGWKNLHHAGAPEIAAELVVEDASVPVTATRTWAEDGFASSSLAVRRGSEALGGLSALGWEAALTTYRPFLSYNELGALYDEPSALFDALEGILGMEEVAEAQARVAEVRKAAERQTKDVKKGAAALCQRLEGVDDERARSCLALLSARGAPDVEAIAAQLDADGPEGAAESELRTLRGLAAMRVVDGEDVATKAAALRTAVGRLSALAGSSSARDAQAMALLEAAVGFREAFGDGDCPVCHRADALDAAWAERSAATIEALRVAAAEAQAAKRGLEQAVRALRQLLRPVPVELAAAAGVGLDSSGVQAAWDGWLAAGDEVEPLPLAAAIEAALPEMTTQVQALREAAQAELAAKASVWRPLAEAVSAWLVDARVSITASGRLRALKDAEKWLKELGVSLRDDRFQPIAEHAQEVWNTLRRDSNVALARVELSGTATRRRVALNVTVDGVEGVALGVMSQGELHALALSLFLPRVALDESPFRFVIIDDPVQSMDPARVDGLAKVLQEAAKTRQVVVFTHDDRLFEAVRRLQIEADVREVHRRGNSVVEIRTAMDPIKRYVRDAKSVATFEDTIGRKVAERVVPGLCRLALEAGLTTAIRRRRLGRGERHAAVEATIERARKLNTLASLGLFDVSDREADVLGSVNSRFGYKAGDVFKAVNAGAHIGYSGDFEGLVAVTKTLARHFEALK